MFFRKMALLVKPEVTYNTDPTPTGAANAILARNVNIQPLEVEEEERALYQPYLGNTGSVVTAFYGRLDFEVEIAGAGAAGTVPKYGAVLRACSLAEVVEAGVGVTYTPVSAGMESVTVYYNIDGVLHKFTGARGSMSMTFNSRSIPIFKFSFTGVFQSVSDAALPTAVYIGFVTPVAVNKVNTPTFAIHGYNAVMKAMTLDMANDVKYRNLVNYEGVDTVDRAPTGSLEMESTLMATKNWFDVAKNKTTGTLNLVHGTTAGNIIQVQAPNVQVGQLKYADFDGIVMLNGVLTFQPGSSGNDEFSIAVR